MRGRPANRQTCRQTANSVSRFKQQQIQTADSDRQQQFHSRQQMQVQQIEKQDKLFRQTVRLEASNNDGQVHHLLQPAEVENHASVHLEVLASSEHELAQTAAALVVGYASVAAANVVFCDVLLLHNVVSVADAFSWSETHV
ncbi:hypothetical protein Tco_0591904 [Tanacetum coccineum]